MVEGDKQDGGGVNEKGGIDKRWKLLSGEKKWEGLLDPLDSDLRSYIVHYGTMVEAT